MRSCRSSADSIRTPNRSRSGWQTVKTSTGCAPLEILWCGVVAPLEIPWSGVPAVGGEISNGVAVGGVGFLTGVCVYFKPTADQAGPQIQGL
jgi:hypothetical protein